MLEAYIRPIYQRYLVDPFAKYVILSPLQVTYLSALLGIGVFPALFLQKIELATVLLLLSGYCDTLDGTLARYRQTTSAVGTTVDIISDRLVECATIIGLFSIHPGNRGWATLIMLSSILICVTSFLMVGMFTPNTSSKSFYYSPGIMERAEAFIFFIAMMWLPQYFLVLSVLFTFLVLLTALMRVHQFIKQGRVHT